MTNEGVFGASAKRGHKINGTVAPNYIDPISGATWGAHGKAPK